MDVKQGIISIPFLGTIKFFFFKSLNKFKIKSVFRVDSKLNKFIKLGKHKWDIIDQFRLVYKITCSYDRTYEGETKRPLRFRLRLTSESQAARGGGGGVRLVNFFSIFFL